MFSKSTELLLQFRYLEDPACYNPDKAGFDKLAENIKNIR